MLFVYFSSFYYRVIDIGPLGVFTVSLLLVILIFSTSRQKQLHNSDFVLWHHFCLNLVILVIWIIESNNESKRNPSN